MVVGISRVIRAGLYLFNCIDIIRWQEITLNFSNIPLKPSSDSIADSKKRFDPFTLEVGKKSHSAHPGSTINATPKVLYSGVCKIGAWGGICELLPTLSRMLNFFITVDNKYILYEVCTQPQVACTNWKRVMLILTGKSNYTSPLKIPSDSVHRQNVFKKLNELQDEDIRLRLNTYTKFLFVRHPIERILSAFRNKFEKNYTSSAYFKKRFGVKIIKKFRKGIKPKQVPSTGDGVKFSEFVSYLLDTFKSSPQNLNEHWAPFSSLCHPCHVRYQVIGKYETLANDSEYILRSISAPANVHFPEVIPSKTGKYVESYVNTLTSKQLDDLINMYEDDFRIFDYHFRRLV
ncbi:unnamed protein product, partial [Meganyctiphanes norvegica]